MSTTEGTPGQRAAARAHVTQLRQDGGTYRSVAAAAALSIGSVHHLAARPQGEHNPAPPTAVLTVTSPALTPSPAGRGRDPAAAARPARDGPRLDGPHRPGARRPPRDHPRDRPRPRPDRQPRPPRCHRRSTTPGGTNAPPDAPAPTRRRHRRPQARDRRQLARPRRPGRRPARHSRLPPPLRLETRHRHRRQHRHYAPARRHRQRKGA